MRWIAAFEGVKEGGCEGVKARGRETCEGDCCGRGYHIYHRIRDATVKQLMINSSIIIKVFISNSYCSNACTIYTYSIYNIHLQYIQKFSTHEPDRAFSGLCIYSVITMATLTLLLWCLQWRTHLPNVAWRSPRQCCSRGSLRYWTPRSRTTRSADYRLERCPEGVNSTDKVIWMCTITLHHRPL